MEYRKVLAALSIMGISGLTTLAAPPKVEEQPKPKQSATADQRNDARVDGRNWQNRWPAADSLAKW